MNFASILFMICKINDNINNKIFITLLKPGLSIEARSQWKSASCKTTLRRLVLPGYQLKRNTLCLKSLKYQPPTLLQSASYSEFQWQPCLKRSIGNKISLFQIQRRGTPRGLVEQGKKGQISQGRKEHEPVLGMQEHLRYNVDFDCRERW